MRRARSIYQHSAAGSGALGPCGGEVLDVRLPTTIAVIGGGWETTIGIHSEGHSDNQTEVASQTASGSLQRRWPRQQSFIPNPTTPPHGHPSDSLAEGREVFQLQRPRPKCCRAKYPIAKQCSQRGAVEKTKIHATAETPRRRHGGGYTGGAAPRQRTGPSPLSSRTR